MAIQGKYARFDDSRYTYGGASRVMVLGKLCLSIQAFAKVIQEKIELSMQTSKSGRVYTGPGGQVHVASAPGEAPAVESGALLSSIGTRFLAGGLVAEIGVLSRTDPPYAHRLEVGTNMAARPYISPVADWAEKEFYGAVGRTIGQL